MQLHAVYGMDQNWNVSELKQWLNRHNTLFLNEFKNKNIKPPRKEGHQIRFRIRPPAYKTYITKKVMTTVKKHSNSLTPENRLIYMVFGIGEPNEKYNKHLHDFSFQNEKP